MMNFLVTSVSTVKVVFEVVLFIFMSCSHKITANVKKKNKKEKKKKKKKETHTYNLKTHLTQLSVADP